MGTLLLRRLGNRPLASAHGDSFLACCPGVLVLPMGYQLLACCPWGTGIAHGVPTLVCCPWGTGTAHGVPALGLLPMGLATVLKFNVHQRLNDDPGWKGVEVILSDSNVPGEGEHKAVSYIRGQRGLPGWNPNTKHCIYGLDADLIMLALATHEPFFTILREVVFTQNGPPQGQDNASQARMQFFSRDDVQKAEGEVVAVKKEPPKPEIARKPYQFLLGQDNASQARMQFFSRDDVQKAEGEVVAVKKEPPKPEIARKPYQFLLVNVLREYLALELKPPDLTFEFDAERLYDDFVFMCFFVGNDFLPHMPTLDIREGAIELMMRTYKNLLPELGGYLTDGCKLNYERVEKFIQNIGILEDTIFAKRAKELKRQKDRLNYERIEKFIQNIGILEDIIFAKRAKELKRQKDRDKKRKAGSASNAAPNPNYMAASIACGELRAANSMARPVLNFSGGKVTVEVDASVAGTAAQEKPGMTKLFVAPEKPFIVLAPMIGGRTDTKGGSQA
eukprot:gene8307-1581_t